MNRKRKAATQAATIKGRTKQSADLSDDQTLHDDEGVADEVLTHRLFAREQRRMREADENVGKLLKR